MPDEHGDLEPGFWVAMTLAEGAAPLRAYVGEVQVVTERGVRITCVDWLIGTPTGYDVFAPWPSILACYVATPSHDMSRFLESAEHWQTAMTTPATTEGT